MTETCLYHKRHTPGHLTVELHHVVPVAWQLKTTILGPPPFPGTDPRGSLWDARTVAVCPTGHRNVHYWIVTMMKWLAHLKSEDANAAYLAVKVRRSPTELNVALLALQRFVPYGSLLALAGAGEWGQS